MVNCFSLGRILMTAKVLKLQLEVPGLAIIIRTADGADDRMARKT